MIEEKITREMIQQMEGDERMKYEIAEELGLLDRVLENGWKTLSAKETGRIGGVMNSRKKLCEKNIKNSIDKKITKCYSANS